MSVTGKVKFFNETKGYIGLESNASGNWTIIDQGPQVLALNGLAGDVTLAASDGSSISASGSTVTIGGPGGMVNKFRNGTMDVWQRGTSGTVTTSGGYTADGWLVLPTGASATWAQTGGRLVTKNSLQVTGATSVTDLIIKQRIESLIAATFCSQTVTVQAQVYNGSGGSITPKLTVNRPSAQDNYGTTTADVNAVSLQSCPASAWTLVSYTFSANAASYNGLEILFDFGNNFGANTKTVQLTELDIRATPGAATGLNSNPPPPELRPIATELLFCQRYFETSYLNVAPGTASTANYALIVLSSNSIANGAFWGMVRYQVPKRSAPTVSIWSFNGNANGFTNSASTDVGANSATVGTSNQETIALYNNNGSTVTSTALIALFQFTASAEL